MAEITLTPVRYYTESDPYAYATDNRPLEDLAARDEELKEVVQEASDQAATAIERSGPWGGVLAQSDHVSNDHLLFRNVSSNSPTRIHQEPNGNVENGTVTKYDWMFDPFDDNQVTYRITNIYTINGVGSGLNGQNGVAVVGGTKGVGDHFGVFPSVALGAFMDYSANATPLQTFYFDTGDTEWRTPQRGAWRSGRTVAIGDHMLASNCIYRAATAGVTGNTKPTHTSGTVSDGGVSWEFKRSFAGGVGFKPCVMIGDRDNMPKFGMPNVRLQLAKDTAIWNGQKVLFLDNTGTPVWELTVDANTDDFSIRSLTGGGRLRFDAAGSFVQLDGLAFLKNPKAVTDGASVVSILKTSDVAFGNTVPTNVTQFTGLPYQEFSVGSSNGQTTLVHGANIKLLSGANRTLQQGEWLMFKLNSAGTVATQMG